MSLYVAATSIATGFSLTVYGGYEYLTASQKPADEVSNQKKMGLGLVATGVAAIAVGAGLIYSGATSVQMPETFIISPSISTVNELASTIEGVAGDPINALKDALAKDTLSDDSMGAKTFKVLEDTQEISFDNYLPLPDNSVISPSIPTVNKLASTIEEVAACPIHALKDILNYGGSDSITAKTFEILEDTQGISCDNYLPWQNEFHRGGTGYIDGIFGRHLQKPVMWGIDSVKRPYVAIKYVCNETKEETVTFFQRYPNTGESVVPGTPDASCYLGSLNPFLFPEKFLDNLTSLLKGETVTRPRWDGQLTLLTLAK